MNGILQIVITGDLSLSGKALSLKQHKSPPYGHGVDHIKTTGFPEGITLKRPTEYVKEELQALMPVLADLRRSIS